MTTTIESLEFKKTISLGKIAYTGNQNRNEVTIEIEVKHKTNLRINTQLESINDYYTLSICGNIWNKNHSDIVSGGQNLEEIAKLFRANKKVQSIVKIWREWHLNDLEDGSDAQSKAVEYWESTGNKYDYRAACAFLKEMEIYVDRGYTYGSKRLVKPLPESVIEELKELAN